MIPPSTHAVWCWFLGLEVLGEHSIFLAAQRQSSSVEIQNVPF